MRQAERVEITQELLSDIERAVSSNIRDYFPSTHYQLKPLISLDPAGVSWQLLGKTDATREEALRQVANSSADTFRRMFPSLPLEWTVIGGSSAAGIVCRVLPQEEAPVYGHIVKLRFAWLRPSEWLRRLRPNLPERIDL